MSRLSLIVLGTWPCGMREGLKRQDAVLVHTVSGQIACAQQHSEQGGCRSSMHNDVLQAASCCSGNDSCDVCFLLKPLIQPSLNQCSECLVMYEVES